MATLVLAEHQNQSLKASTLGAVSAASQLNQEIVVLVAGHNAEGAASEAAKISGVAKVLRAESPALEHSLAEPLALLLQALSGDYSHIVTSAGTFGKNVLPRLAGLLQTQAITDVTQIHSPKSFTRPIYAGNAMARVTTTSPKVLLSVRHTSFDKPATDGNAPVEQLSGELTQPASQYSKSKFIKLEASESDRPELTSARVVVSGGRGLASGENFNLLEKLADKLNAAMGASRAAVDAGFVPNDWQVGQTGKIVAPDLYIAVGISGAIQHLAGIKDAKVIVAINKDEEAPIFQVATYGLAADLFQVLPELTEKL